jgi:hypothetical protein
MGPFKNFFSTRWGIISVGAFIGVFAPLLQKWGNPGNMGICVACFERDIAKIRERFQWMKLKEEINGSIQELFFDTVGNYKCRSLYRGICPAFAEMGQSRKHGHLRGMF